MSQELAAYAGRGIDGQGTEILTQARAKGDEIGIERRRGMPQSKGLPSEPGQAGGSHAANMYRFIAHEWCQRRPYALLQDVLIRVSEVSQAFEKSCDAVQCHGADMRMGVGQEDHKVRQDAIETRFVAEPGPGHVHDEGERMAYRGRPHRMPDVS